MGDSDSASKGEGGNLVIWQIQGQIQAAQWEPLLNVGARWGQGLGWWEEPSLSQHMYPLPPEPLPGSPCGPLLPPSSLLLPWLFLSGRAPGLTSFPRFSGECPDCPQDFHCQSEALTMRSRPELPQGFSSTLGKLARKREEGL